MISGPHKTGSVEDEMLRGLSNVRRGFGAWLLIYG